MIPPLLFATLMAGAAACHPVEADEIYGRNLAAAVPALAGLPPGIPVGHAPVPGMERVFTPPELRHLAREYGLDPSGFLANVCFIWPVEPLTPTAIGQAIEKTLAGRSPQIEIVSWSLAPAPRGELVFPMTGLDALTDKPTIWKGYVIYGGARHFATWANVRISVGETHLVLDKPLQAGVETDKAQIHTESYRGPLQREHALTNIAQLRNLIARHDLPAGVTLFGSMFEAPREVKLGELVTVVVENGGARVETQGVARQAGRHGEIITVLNPKTGRAYRARIEGKSSVTVVPGGSVGLVGDERKEDKS
jgi:flagella basal body P-ring formation protein FlgA